MVVYTIEDWPFRVFSVIKAPGLCPRRGFKLTSSSIGFRHTDQVASKPDASRSLSRLLYIALSSTTLGIEKYRLPCSQESESARQVNLPVTYQAVCVAQPQPDRQFATCQA